MAQHHFDGVLFIEEVNGGVMVNRLGRKMLFKNVDFEALKNGIQRYLNGTLIQDALGFLTADEREFLITGLLPSEWNSIFGQEE